MVAVVALWECVKSFFTAIHAEDRGGQLEVGVTVFLLGEHAQDWKSESER